MFGAVAFFLWLLLPSPVAAFVVSSRTVQQAQASAFAVVPSPSRTITTLQGRPSGEQCHNRATALWPLMARHQLSDTDDREDSPSSLSSSPSVSKWQSYASCDSDATRALTDILGNVKHQSNDKENTNRPNVAFLFVSTYHAGQFESLVRQAAQQLSLLNCRLVSVVGSGVIGADSEYDEPTKPSMSLLVGYNLPNPADSIEIFDFNELTKPPPDSLKDWSTNGNGASVMIYADPWSPLSRVIEALGPDAVVAGGVSVPTGVGPTVAVDSTPLPQGSLVGVHFKDDLHLQVVTAQGCRPVNDESFTITAAQGSCILELDSQPALQVLEKVVKSINDPNEQKIVSSGLVCGLQACTDENEHCSVVMDSDDYLIRQILGYVPAKGGLLVAGAVNIGERLRFHVRDTRAAEQDMKLMMQRARTERTVFGSKGNLVCAFQISCVARGRSLFCDSNVDLKQTKSLLGPEDGPVVAGFFANGEIGPVGIAGFTKDKNGVNSNPSHVHGFTTVVAYLCDTSNAKTEDGTENRIPASPLVDEPTAWG